MLQRSGGAALGRPRNSPFTPFGLETTNTRYQLPKHFDANFAYRLTQGISMSMDRGNVKIVTIKLRHIPGSQYDGSSWSIYDPTGLYA